MDDIFFRFLTRDSSPPDAIPTRRGAPLRRWGRGLLAKEGKWIYARNYSLKKGPFLYGASHVMVFVFSGTLILSIFFAVLVSIFVFKVPEKANTANILAIIIGFATMIGSGIAIYSIKKYLKAPVDAEDSIKKELDQSA